MQQKPLYALMILVRGLPGSGKTYIATELQKSLGEGVFLLDPDAIEYESDAYRAHVQTQISEGVEEALHPYRYLRAQAYDGIAKGRVVIWNQPFTNLEIFNKMVANFYAQAKEYGVDLSVLVVEVYIDPAIAKERVMQRKQAGGHGPSDGTFDRFVRDYKTFADEGYRVVRVNGSDSAQQSVKSILAAIEQRN